MSGRQELVSTKYIPDEIVEAEARLEQAREGSNSSDSFVLWGFFAVAMTAIVMFTRSMM